MNFNELFLDDTPYEQYILNDRIIDVKREDLYCSDKIAPLAKMRGVNIIMNHLKSTGQNIVGVFDFKVSKAGVGISAMASKLEMRCIECYQHYKHYDIDGLPEQQKMCASWGAELYPVKAAQIEINFNMGKRYVNSLGGYMFPKGIILSETMQSVRNVIIREKDILKQYNHIVLCVGSGTILSGIAQGLIESGLNSQIHGVACTNSVIHCKGFTKYFREQNPQLNIKIYPSSIFYYDNCEEPCPFPSHPNYDKKAWFWLKQNVKKLNGKILFWNIGA